MHPSEKCALSNAGHRDCRETLAVIVGWREAAHCAGLSVRLSPLLPLPNQLLFSNHSFRHTSREESSRGPFVLPPPSWHRSCFIFSHLCCEGARKSLTRLVRAWSFSQLSRAIINSGVEFYLILILWLGSSFQAGRKVAQQCDVGQVVRLRSWFHECCSHIESQQL